MRIIVSNPIKGYEGLYDVNIDGKIYSYYSNTYLTPVIGLDGYARVSLVKNKIRRTCTVHRLVAETFIHNPRRKTYVDHKDKNRANNSKSNLRWATPRENNLYSKHSRTNLRGAYYHKRLNKWEAAIMIDGSNRFYIGIYPNKKDAYYAFHFCYTVLFNKEPFDICLIE